MGNCLVRQEEEVTRIVKPDGKVLEYKASITVRDVLSEFSGHAISDTLQASQSQQLQPDTRLLHGRLYYLLPLPVTTKSVQKKKKRVRFSTPEAEPDRGAGAVRIKLVISKQELHDMLTKGGLSIDEMILRAKNGESINRVDSCDVTDNCQGWKPELETIPE